MAAHLGLQPGPFRPALSAGWWCRCSCHFTSRAIVCRPPKFALLFCGVSPVSLSSVATQCSPHRATASSAKNGRVLGRGGWRPLLWAPQLKPLVWGQGLSVPQIRGAVWEPGRRPASERAAAGCQVQGPTRLFLDHFLFPSLTSILACGIVPFSFWL